MATHFKGPIVSENGFTGDIDGYVTPQSVTVAATSTGVAVPAGTDFVTITSANANNIVILPAPVAGEVVKGANVSATACEIRSSNPATIAVNNVTGTGKEAVLAAGASFDATCISATKWILHNYGATGTMTNPVPD